MTTLSENSLESSDFDVFDMMYDSLSESQVSFSDRSFDSLSTCLSISPSTMDECLHSDIVNADGVDICQACGSELKQTTSHEKEWRYYGNNDGRQTDDPNRVQNRSDKFKTIHKDIEMLEFDKRVVEISNDIYIDITKGKIYRGRSRRAMIFACIFHAFKQIMKPQSHAVLCHKFGISEKAGFKGLKFVNLNSTKAMQACSTFVVTTNIISDIMNNIKATELQKQEVINIYSQIKNRSSKLNRSRPQSVACGLVFYWLKKEAINITLREFSHKTDLSELTINTVMIEIENILANS